MMKKIVSIWLCAVLLFGFAVFNAGGSDLGDFTVNSTSHSPIRINSNADFDVIHGIVGGDGTAGSPWLLDGWDIDGTGYGHCLYIGNTTDYFTIKNCAFSNASGGIGPPFFTDAGITLFNTINGNITNNTIMMNGNGVYLNSTNWCGLTLNNISLNGYGMRLDNASANNTLYHNNFLGNTVQAYDDGSNVWNLTTGGNHWSDWTTPDANADGFVDNIYAIPGSWGDGNIPTGYYDPAAGLTGEPLKTALHNVIKGHTEWTYDDLWTILTETDEDPNNPDNFILLYTGRSIPKTDVYPEWNREHVWAKSHGNFAETPPAGTDAHHLRPADVSVNSDRGNLDFDDGGSQHPEATECYYDSDSWEPRDAVKGDIARMMFYMATRYDGDPADNGGLDLELVDYVPTSGPIFGKLSTLLAWHINDPVDEIDRQRNEVVYSYQNNRNPFIDHPEYVDAIWGSGNPPVSSGGGSTNRDYLPFAILEGWNAPPAPPGPVHNIDQATDHNTIQLGIDNAIAGDRILVDAGTYFENVIIDRALTITATMAIIDGGGSGTVVEIQAGNVEISGFSIMNGGALATDSGIKLNNVDFCKVHNNNISNVQNGIYISTGCDNNTLENNTISSSVVGVNSLGSWNMIFHNNFLTNTEHAKDKGLNAWDMGYPVGGNFFDNWTTPDLNSDGFVDEPFIIPGASSGAALDLEGYRIEQYGSALTWTFGAGASVQPEGYVVIGRLADKAAFESSWGITFAPEVVYINANNIAGSTFLVINGGETYELFDNTATSIDGPTGYIMVTGNSAQRTLTSADATLSGSWNVVSRDLATPGTGANGDSTAGLVINEYSDAASYQYEFVELYYDSSSTGGSNNQDNWPYSTENAWISTSPQTHNIDLEAGWNLISLPLMPQNSSVIDILGSIDWDVVKQYDSSDATDPWKTSRAGASTNDLAVMDNKKGYWVHMNSATTLTINGTAAPFTAMNLKAGWNLVGYPSLDSTKTISMALAGTGYDRVEGSSAIAPYVQALSDSYVMRPGEGYWVHVPADSVWVVDW